MNSFNLYMKCLIHPKLGVKVDKVFFSTCVKNIEYCDKLRKYSDLKTEIQEAEISNMRRKINRNGRVFIYLSAR